LFIGQGEQIWLYQSFLSFLKVFYMLSKMETFILQKKYGKLLL